MGLTFVTPRTEQVMGLTFPGEQVVGLTLVTSEIQQVMGLTLVTQTGFGSDTRDSNRLWA